MMIPNTTGMLSKFIGLNGYSEPSWAAPKLVRCAVVDLGTVVKKTSVRTDQSASHGTIEEETAVAKILFLPNVGITDNDKFSILGIDLVVNGVTPRNNVLGKLDHFEVDFGIFVS